MKALHMAVLLIVSCIVSIPTTSFAQSWMPILRSESGDTIPYIYPPPDSSYDKNSIIVKFRLEGLLLDKLCYSYWIDAKNDEKKSNELQGILSSQRSALYSEQFPIDTIVKDTSLRTFMKMLGAVYLKRITIANPCTDTITIARDGDTLRCTDYLWMTLHLNNDTSIINTCTLLTIFFQNSIEFAEPNYFVSPDRIPNDPLHSNANGLKVGDFGIGAERAWDFQVGNYGIKCGVVDDGVDWQHCDLGGARGLGQKVVGGWNWVNNNDAFQTVAGHGTPCASIIGARTNRGCATGSEGVSGIAGGWGPSGGGSDEGIGVQIFGFRVFDPGFILSKAIAAIREGSANNPSTGYGYGVHLLNNSWGTEDYSEALHAAVNYSFEHGVSFMASRGNSGSTVTRYPGTYENTWVSCVGSADNINSTRNKRLWRDDSNYSRGMDCLAPGRNNVGVITTQCCRSGGGYTWFSQTSAATPHVTGTIALLRSEALENGWSDLEPEDYEGMVKSSCELRVGTSYHQEDAWGFLRTDRIFDRLQDGYRVSHYSSASPILLGNWSAQEDWAFFNDGRTAKPIASGNYKVRYRRVTGTITLPSNKWLVSTTEPLYVWGRSGQGANSGFNLAQPCYQTGYTAVINGFDGNSTEFIFGLRNSDGNNIRTVDCLTYQYEVSRNGVVLGTYPPLSKIQFNISAYGKETTLSSVKLEDQHLQSIGVDIAPNPSYSKVTFNYSVREIDKVTIRITDAIGNTTFLSEPEMVEPGNYRLTLPVDSWTSGVYYCTVLGEHASAFQVFTIVH